MSAGPSAGGLSTHVLDTARGKPAAGVRVELFRVTEGSRQKVTEAVTNQDGRTDQPLIERGNITPGTFELTFYVADYYQDFPTASQPPFLDMVTLRFTVADAGSHYHVPLVMTPWSYSTYRGS